MRAVYTPIFDGFFEGSIMLEEVETRFLFIVLLRLALRPGADGIVDIPLSRLAAIAAMTEDATRRALDALMRPDKLSGSEDEGGRRLVPLKADRPDRGWRVVNVQKYRDAVHDAHAAARMRRIREERAQGADVPDVPDVPFRSHETRRSETRRDDTSAKEGGSGGEVVTRYA